MNRESPSIPDAVRALREGRLVAFPTETVYGLGADALNPTAVQRVFDVKGRPPNNPLIVHVRGPDAARALVNDWPPSAIALTRALWPGPLTIVLPRSSLIPDIVTAGGPNVALRSPDHPLALALLFEFGGPLVGPSANRSGYVSPTRAEHVRSEFPNGEVLILDGGRGSSRVGIESTVLSIAGPHPIILRPGAITADDIERIIGTRPSLADESITSDLTHPLSSPGTLPKHYAPRRPCRLLTRQQLLAALASAHDPVVVLSHTLDPSSVAEPDLLLPMPPNADDYAAALYESLREADQTNAATILIEDTPQEPGLWQAIRDRLRRATWSG